MQFHAILASALLGCTLIAPLAMAAGPRTFVPPTWDPPPESSSVEVRCYAYGRFVYVHTIARDDGVPFLLALSASRQWDHDRGFSQAIKDIHEIALETLYRLPELDPFTMEQQATRYCVGEAAKAAQTSPARMYFRY